MKQFRYLIIGGGMAADSAIKGIREIDETGSIGLVSMEEYPPYDRPPLTKALWKGKPLDKIWRHVSEEEVTMYLGRKIVSLDCDNMTAIDENKDSYKGDKILIATGGTPRHFSFGENIVYYRTLDSYKQLEKLAKEGTKDQVFAVIGGGFIGSEIAAALAMNDKKVTMLMPEDGIGSRIFPPDMSEYINDYYRQKGVEIGRAHV